MNFSSDAPSGSRPASGPRKYTSRKNASSKALVMTSMRRTLPPAARLNSGSTSSSSKLASRTSSSSLTSGTRLKTRSSSGVDDEVNDRLDDDSIFDVPSSEDEKAPPKKISSLRTIARMPTSSTLKQQSRVAGAAPALPAPRPTSNNLTSSNPPVSQPSSHSVVHRVSTVRQSTAKSQTVPKAPTSSAKVPPPPQTSTSPKRKANPRESPQSASKRPRSTRNGLTATGSPPRLNPTRSAPSKLESWLNPPSLAHLDQVAEEDDKSTAPDNSTTVSFQADNVCLDPQDDEDDSPTLPPQTVSFRRGDILSRLLSSPTKTTASENSTGKTVSAIFQAKVAPGLPSLTRSVSDVQPRRRKLVDSLKAVSFQVEQDSDNDSHASWSGGSDRAKVRDTARLSRSPSPAMNTRPGDQPFPSQTLQPGQIRRFGRVASATAGAKVTYGEVRTLLAEEPQSFEDQVDQMLSGFSSRPLKDTEIDEGLSSPDDNHGAIRSAHELRAVGDKTRFVDDMELLLADIEITSLASTAVASTKGRRRNGMCELARKCADKSFVERMCTFSFDQRVVGVAVKERDPIVLIAWTVAVGFVLHWTSSRLVPVMVWETVFGSNSNVLTAVISSLLEIETDIAVLAKNRTMNMSRVAIDELAGFKEFVLSSSEWFDCPTTPESPGRLSPRDVSLKFIDTLVRRLRGAGVMEESILDLKTVADIAAIGAGVVSLALGPNPVLGGQTKPSLVAIKQAQLAQSRRQLEIVLSILESESLSRVSFNIDICRTIIGTISAVLVSQLRPESTSMPRLPALALRLTLNMTNNKPEMCAIFVEPGVAVLPMIYRYLVAILYRASAVVDHQLRTSTGADPNVQDGTVTDELSKSITDSTDVLILSLGAAINLAEHNAASRSVALTPLPSDMMSSIGTDLPSPLPAALDFESSPSALTALAAVFFHAHAQFASTPVAVLQAETEKSASVVSQIQVAHGYLAVLLGNLCLLPDALAVVAGHDPVTVPSPVSDRPLTPTSVNTPSTQLTEPAQSPIQILITTIREFVVYHRAVDGAAPPTASSAQGPGSSVDATGFHFQQTDQSNMDHDLAPEMTPTTNTSSALWHGWTNRLLSVVDRLEAGVALSPTLLS